LAAIGRRLAPVCKFIVSNFNLGLIGLLASQGERPEPGLARFGFAPLRLRTLMITRPTSLIGSLSIR